MFSFLRKPASTDIIGYELDIEVAQSRVSGELAEIFFRHTSRPVMKWIDYLPIYDRHFRAFREMEDLVFLEIGVSGGGSLEMWREYFGPGATICGIDIDPACADRVDEPNHVRIGSQDDPQFLRNVVSEIGRPHIVLDDGSHVATHQRTSFRTLFPLLNDEGIYAIEDLHTAYWPWFEGGHKRKGTAIEMVKALSDALNGWWHDEPTIVRKEDIYAVHNYESISLIEKGPKQRPGYLIMCGEKS